MCIKEWWSFFQKQQLSLAAAKTVPYAAAAVQQQRYNGSRASSPCLCASSHGAYVWLAHSRRSNHFHVKSNNQTHIVETSYWVYEARSKSKNNSSHHTRYEVHIIGTPVFTLLDLRRPRHIKSTPFRTETLYDVVHTPVDRIISKIWSLRYWGGRAGPTP